MGRILVNTKFIFLDLIAKNDGKWSWYQLERGLNARGVGGQVNTINELNSLLAEGLITEHQIEKHPHPLYLITDEGRSWLNQFKA